MLTEPEITPVSEEFINYDLTRNMYPPGYRLPQAPKGYGLYFEERQITVAHSDGMLIRPNLSIEEFEKISKCQNGYSNVPKRSMTKMIASARMSILPRALNMTWVITYQSINRFC